MKVMILRLSVIVWLLSYATAAFGSNGPGLAFSREAQSGDGGRVSLITGWLCSVRRAVSRSGLLSVRAIVAIGYLGFDRSCRTSGGRRTCWVKYRWRSIGLWMWSD